MNAARTPDHRSGHRPAWRRRGAVAIGALLAM